MLNEELFDQKVERFLKKQMSPEEERLFKDELASDPEKLDRAKAIALAIRQMKISLKEKDEKIVAAIKETDNQTLHDIVNESFTSEFDERVESFLKGQMSEQEEKSFFADLKNYPDLELRAKVMALALQQMKESAKDKDMAIIEKIRNTDMKTLEAIVKGNNSGGNGGARIITLRRFMAIAASILLIIGFYDYHVSSQTKSLFDEQASFTAQLNQSLTSRSKGTASDSIIVKEISNIFALVQNGDSIDYAIDCLTSYSDSKYDDYRADIDWNLAMAYVRDGNRKQAKLILQRIIEKQTGLPIADKAQEVLEKINDIGLFN